MSKKKARRISVNKATICKNACTQGFDLLGNMITERRDKKSKRERESVPLYAHWV